MVTLLVALLILQVELAVERFLGSADGRRWHYAGEGATSFEPDSGLLLHRLSLADGTSIEYERPVVLLPASLEPGEVHESQRRFVRRRGDEKLDVGAHYFEAELLGTAPVETAAGRFDDCLEVRRHVVRMDYSGGQEGFDVTEWWAPEVGLVEATGTRFVKDADGNTVSTEPIQFELESLAR